MKHLFIAALLALPFSIKAQGSYDKKLADSLGADEYGMKKYVLAILKTGSFKTGDKKLADSLFRGHMNNIERLVKEHKLVVAGPLGKNEKSYRGIFILSVPTVDEARALVETDPAIKAKLFDVELYPWYGSAALPMYLDASERISKKSH
ncbi:MAG TPA: YciI family protein [Flavipsychrobacter sp.]|nr:YciI family protein [Flavipsychrobacter sp.]